VGGEVPHRRKRRAENWIEEASLALGYGGGAGCADGDLGAVALLAALGGIKAVSVQVR